MYFTGNNNTAFLYKKNKHKLLNVKQAEQNAESKKVASILITEGR